MVTWNNSTKTSSKTVRDRIGGNEEVELGSKGGSM